MNHMIYIESEEKDFELLVGIYATREEALFIHKKVKRFLEKGQAQHIFPKRTNGWRHLFPWRTIYQGANHAENLTVKIKETKHSLYGGGLLCPEDDNFNSCLAKYLKEAI